MKFISIISVGRKPSTHIRTVNIWMGTIGLAVVLAFSSFLGTWKCVKTFFEYVYFQSLSCLEYQKNIAFKKKINRMQWQADGIQSKMKVSFLFEDRVRSIYGLSAIAGEARQLGTGGFSESALDVQRENMNKRLGISPLVRDMNLLGRQANLQTLQFEKLKSEISKKNQFWTHRPSIDPTRGRVTSDFGFRIHPVDGEPSMHEGIDIACPAGTSVVASANGIVRSAGYSGRFGNLLIISHGYGYNTYYGHLRRMLVREGQIVSRGDLIGYVGQTGMATGPHLHYEVRFENRPMDPSRHILPMRYIVD